MNVETGGYVNGNGRKRKVKATVKTYDAEVVPVETKVLEAAE